VSPIVRVLPLAGEQTTGTVASTKSVAVTSRSLIVGVLMEVLAKVLGQVVAFFAFLAVLMGTVYYVAKAHHVGETPVGTPAAAATTPASAVFTRVPFGKEPCD
jgi:hypothetical protein